MDTRAKILHSASELLLDKGLEALTVRSIAQNAGMSTIGLYRQFQGKQDVLDELCIEGFSRLSNALREVTATSGNPKTTILKVTEKYLDIAERYKAHYLLMFEASSVGYQPSSQARQASTSAFEELTAHVEEIPNLTEKASVVAMEMWALVHGFVGLARLLRPSGQKSATTRRLVLSAVEAHIAGRSKQIDTSKRED